MYVGLINPAQLIMTQCCVLAFPKNGDGQYFQRLGCMALVRTLAHT